MSHWVDITFDCLPLRSISRLDIPLDASPKYRKRCQRLKDALEKHGSLNSYFIYNAHCIYHLTNQQDFGTLDFKLEGTVLTDTDDQKTKSADIDVQLHGDTCQWLTEPIVQWFMLTVEQAIIAEFDCYITAGDLDQTKARIDKIQQESDDSGGYMGMYL